MVRRKEFINITEAGFKAEVLDSTIPVLVEFGASWCGGSHIIAPILEEVAEMFQQTIRVIHISLETEAGIRTAYGIGKIPALVLFNRGTIREHITGMISKKELIRRLEKVVMPAVSERY